MEKKFKAGDVVMYVASHEAYSGLYLLGQPNDLHIGYDNAAIPYNVALRNCTLATNEQRKQFMDELHLNGYEWDENEKKLYKLKDFFDAIPAGELHTQVRIPVFPEFDIEVGKWYKCIKDFTAAPGCGFKEGSLYLSEKEDCLTDDFGFKENTFGRDVAIWFRPATEEELGHQEVIKRSDQELIEFERSLKNVLEETLECGDTHNLKADAELLLFVARKQLIEEACEWLKENIYWRVYKQGDDLGFPTAEFLKDFRKALEKGEV